jgi:aryl-alcohol dehydrogenase-like predicted oxidoreductase
VKAGDNPTTTFGKTGMQVSIIAQGSAWMDLHPDIQTAAAHVRRVYGLAVTYFDYARAY